MKFSLIICTYQRPKPLLQLLQSVQEQTLYPDEILIIEAKFWASLTENQPISYLKRLKENSILLFVCPTLRKNSLFVELKKKLTDENIIFTSIAATNPKVISDNKDTINEDSLIYLTSPIKGKRKITK